ncbi:MAG: hypothetical protein ACRD8K_08430, partial [Nitrososphaeraceae archaeon]
PLGSSISLQNREIKMLPLLGEFSKFIYFRVKIDFQLVYLLKRNFGNLKHNCLNIAKIKS